MREGTFNLRRWFAIVGSIAIAAISLVAATLGSRAMSERLIRQDAELALEFVQSAIPAGTPGAAFEAGGDSRRALESMLSHVANMTDVLRANIYARDGTILWSSNRELIGRRFEVNPELDAAWGGSLVAESGTIDAGKAAKPERATLDEGARYFVESYLPVRLGRDGPVAAVVEIYKTPRRLFEVIHGLQRAIWVGALAAGLFLYATLFWMIRRADNLIRAQQDRLVQAETLAVMGEMGTAVAHGIRNPLASIRSSAELALDGALDEARASARDIITEVDRLDQWVHALVNYSRPVSGSLRRIDPGVVVRDCLTVFERDARQLAIDYRGDISGTLPPVVADPVLLTQVLCSLVSNAFEAQPAPSVVSVRAAREPDGKTVRIAVRDDGPGMSAKDRERAFKPFYTTKTKGLGIGLPLARRVIERFGGRLELESVPGRGTEARVYLPAAE